MVGMEENQLKNEKIWKISKKSKLKKKDTRNIEEK
jgi:hypothetical protein